MTLGKKIIDKQFGLISIDEADSIYRDLNQFNDTGVWHVLYCVSPQTPAWVIELAEHHKTGEADVVIQLVGWQVIAKTYRDRSNTAGHQRKLEKEDSIKNRIHLTLSSYEYGCETFGPYDGLDETMKGMRRLIATCMSFVDKVHRTISIDISPL